MGNNQWRTVTDSPSENLYRSAEQADESFILMFAVSRTDSLRTDIEYPQTTIAANVQPSATDHGVRKIRIGGLARQVELADDFESPWRDLQ